MAYNSFNFIVLFPLIFLLYYAIPAKCHKARNLFLIVVSYSLYTNYKPAYALVLIGVTIISFVTALMIEKNKEVRKVFIVLGGVIIILPLLVFKYCNFINGSIYDLLSFVGLRFQLQGLNWAIPIGLSFYSLQAMGYVFDVYYKKIEAEKDFLDYALYISFFPTVISGPINRASSLLKQIKNRSLLFNEEQVVKGLRLILWGMFLKVVVADRSGLYVDSVYENYQIQSGMTLFFASVFYSMQIYFDFAGYSLMAVGVGKTLGFEIIQNFNRPYFSQTLGDFWRRWHISLSTWLRDYVYIPLGGSRCGRIKTYRNLVITFFLSGLWHGANWNYILWGVTHSLWLIGERIIPIGRSDERKLIKCIKIIVVFLFVNFTWILFRFESLTDAIAIITKILTFENILDAGMPSGLAILAVTIAVLKELKDEWLWGKVSFFSSRKITVRWVSYVATLSFILLEGVLDSGQFIYCSF